MHMARSEPQAIRRQPGTLAGGAVGLMVTWEAGFRGPFAWDYGAEPVSGKSMFPVVSRIRVLAS